MAAFDNWPVRSGRPNWGALPLLTEHRSNGSFGPKVTTEIVLTNVGLRTQNSKTRPSALGSKPVLSPYEKWYSKARENQRAPLKNPHFSDVFKMVYSYIF